MTHLQQQLRDGLTEAELLVNYGIRATPHKTHPHLILFKYNQIASPMAERIVQEARGIVLDSADDWRCVARGFDKFFNYGEPHAAELDWTTARVQEKVDGSLLLLYWHGDRWHVATTGTPDASGPVGSEEITFADLFWQTFGATAGRDSLQRLDKAYTYLFELTSPRNRVVVPHTSDGLTLLAARRSEDGEWLCGEAWVDLCCRLSVGRIREFPLTSIEEILTSFEAIDPMRQEGYVVVDGQDRRLKVKHPQYVAIHHLKNAVSLKFFVEVVRQGEAPEVIAHFPELAAQFQQVQADYAVLQEEVQMQYGRIREIETQKDFAAAALSSRLSPALFQLRAGKIADPAEFFQRLPIDNLLRYLGYKEEASREEQE